MSIGFRPVEPEDYRNVNVSESLVFWVVAPAFFYLYTSNITGTPSAGWTAAIVVLLVNLIAPWLPASIMGLMVFYWIFGTAAHNFFFG